MGSRGPVPNPHSSESRRGRNTMYRRPAGSAAKQKPVEPPDFVKEKPAALAFWSQHAPALAAAKRLQPLQAETFGVLCEMFADLRLLTAAVASEGLLIETARGPRPNPKVGLLRDARRDLLAAARGFGLDAISDARLPAEPPEPEPNALDEFFAKHGVPKHLDRSRR